MKRSRTRRGRRKHEVGRVREKLGALLRAEGFDVEGEELFWADGQNSHVTEDCYRWDAYVRGATRSDMPPIIPGTRIYLHSWDSMTLCVRRGIEVVKDADATQSYEIHARSAR